MKHIGVLAVSAAALLVAGTLSAMAAPHGGGGGHFSGGGAHFAGGGAHFGGGAAHFSGGAARFAAPNAGAANFAAARVGVNANVAAAPVGRGSLGGGYARRGYGRGLGYGLAGAGIGYGLGYAYGGDYGYGYGYPDYAYGDPAYYGDPSYAYGDAGYGVNYADAPQYSPIQTGRSAAYGGLGKYCTTPVKTCTLYEPSAIGANCSCKVAGGRAQGDVTP